DNYEFVLMFSHGAGACALMNFLFLLGRFHSIDYFCGGEGDVRYNKFYNRLLELKNERNIISINDVAPSWYGNKNKRDKLFSSFQKITPILFQIRDPMELIKHAYGRKWGNDLAKSREFDLSFQFNDIIKEVENYTYNLPDNLEGQKPQSFLWKTLKDCFAKFTDCTYLDISKIRGKETIKTMHILAKKFNFQAPKQEDEEYLTKSLFGGNLYFLFPLMLYANKEDLLKSKRNINVNKKADSIIIYIKALEHNKNYIDLYGEIGLQKTENLIGIYIKKDDYYQLKKDSIFCKEVFLYIKKLVEKLYHRIQIEDDLMLKVEDVLKHLRNNSSARISAKNILDEELVCIKQHHPDIVASWKYYQEFEKMCEELDGESEIKQIENNSN
ncbi:DUF2972 domain-containing protein, partial [Campylobacter sp. RM10536]|uniref:DUF2972 domain-containing protein n=3 Tax=Campylobacter molothri TaxID=1032242 RepID=UPI001D21584F|nr:DUF2972 domain-containing protein [Campylobacter sp. RM10536]